MTNVLVYIFASVLIVSSISLAGALTLVLGRRLLESVLIYLVSFSAGTLLGSAFFDLLPEAAGNGFTVQVAFSVLGGIIVCFVLEKFVRWRHCHIPANENHPHPFSSLILFSDSLHNFIDGTIITASYLVSIPLGVATTLAVISHEIPQEIGDFASLIYGGLGRSKALLFNFLSALASFAGVIAVLLLKDYFHGIVDFLVPFAAGNFIYIASSDLFPEIHKEVQIKKSILQLAFFITGLILIFSVI